jgi:hypothetical protein
MTKNQHGKRAIFFYGQSIFLIIVMAGIIYAINVGNGPALVLDKKNMITHLPMLQNRDRMISEMTNTPPLELAWHTIIGMMFIPVFIIKDFPVIAIMLSAMNDEFQGMVLNLYTAGLVEYMGVFGMMVFYRLILSSNKR